MVFGEVIANMKSYPNLKRGLLGVATLGVLAAIVAVSTAFNASNTNDATPPAQQKAQKKVDSKKYPWPMFGGTLDRNLVNKTDKNIPLKFVVDPAVGVKNLLWKQELGSRSYGGPVVAEGKILVGTNNKRPRDPKVVGDRGIYMCFDASDGEFLFQKVYEKLPGGKVHDWPFQGICSTPVIENGRMYYVSNRCELVCADLNNEAKHIWKIDMMKDLGVVPHNIATCSPIVVNDDVFTCTSNGVAKDHIGIPAPKAPSFIAVNKNKGTVIWGDNSPTINLTKQKQKGKKLVGFIKKLINDGKLLMHGQWSNPGYAEINGVPQVIFPAGDGWIRAYNPSNGKLVWKFDGNPKGTKYELGGRGTRNDFVNTPVVYKNKLYIGVGQDPEHDRGVGHFWCIDLVKATKFGPTNPDNDVSPKKNNWDPSAEINAKSALAWHYGGAGTAKERIPRTDYVFGRTLSTACVVDDIVYIPELAGYLHILDAKTGKRLAYQDFRTPIWSSPYYVDGKVFLGDDRGILHVYKHDPKRRGKIREADNMVDMLDPVRATPICANGILYIMTETTLYAIKQK